LWNAFNLFRRAEMLRREGLMCVWFEGEGGGDRWACDGLKKDTTKNAQLGEEMVEACPNVAIAKRKNLGQSTNVGLCADERHRPV
jgi:hypothetical protein